MENMKSRVRYKINAFELQSYLNSFVMHAEITKSYRLDVSGRKLTIEGHPNKKANVSVSGAWVDGWRYMHYQQIHQLTLALTSMISPEATVDIELCPDGVRVLLFI